MASKKCRKYGRGGAGLISFTTNLGAGRAIGRAGHKTSGTGDGAGGPKDMPWARAGRAVGRAGLISFTNLGAGRAIGRAGHKTSRMGGGVGGLIRTCHGLGRDGFCLVGGC